MNRSPVRFRQEAPQKSGPHQDKHPVGVLFTQIEVAGCHPSCCPSVSHSVSHVPLRSPVATHSISALDLPPRAPTPASTFPNSCHNSHLCHPTNCGRPVPQLQPLPRTAGTARQTSKVVKNRHQAGDSGAQRPFFTTSVTGKAERRVRRRNGGGKGGAQSKKGGTKGREGVVGSGKGPHYQLIPLPSRL